MPKTLCWQHVLVLECSCATSVKDWASLANPHAKVAFVPSWLSLCPLLAVPSRRALGQGASLAPWLSAALPFHEHPHRVPGTPSAPCLDCSGSRGQLERVRGAGKAGSEAREGQREEQMRRGRKESVYFALLHLVAHLRDAEQFSLCYANPALVSTNRRALPSLPGRLLARVEAPSQHSSRGHRPPHRLPPPGLLSGTAASRFLLLP